MTRISIISFLVLFLSLAGASHLMSSLSLSTPSLSLSLPSLPITTTLPSVSLSSPTLSSTTSTTTTSVSPTTSSSSSTTTTTSSLPSSSPSSSPSSTSAQTSTSSTSTTPASVAQQPYSSSTPTYVATAAGLSGLSSSVVVFTTPTLTPSTAPQSTSSSGFFSNTGAVAGTFTVIGLVSVAGIIAVALLIIRRRHSRSYEEDMEYLDKTPDLSADPPMTNVISPDDAFTSDHGHYTAPPMALASPPAAYYPDHAYALHPNAFPADTSGSRGYPSPYIAGYTQDHAAQHIYSPDDYDIAYPPSAPPVRPNMPNPHEFADVELASTPVPPTQTVFPDALRPSVNSTPTVQKQWANTRFSVDSFYTGIVTDDHSSPGQAL